MEQILQVQNLQKVYGGSGSMARAIDDVSFTVRQGEYVGIMGASGSGKTTLLNCISTIDTVTSGHVFIEGRDVTELKSQELAKFRREKLGFVFQDFNLLDTLTGYENIALALSILKTPPVEIHDRIMAVTQKLEIEKVLANYPYQMSGGQKQRIASARAIVTRPALILADEPTGALDSKSARLLLESFDKLNRELSATILMVTHDPFTASFTHRILFLKDGKLFHELVRGDKSRKVFFDEIMEVISLLGGDAADVL